MVFCTLLDVNFLPRGLVLYRSLRQVSPDSVLRIYCMDSAAKDLLERLDLSGVVVVGLDELETYDPGLRAVRATRSQIEYCWTATPVVCLHSLDDDPDLKMVTYVDADLMFFQNPTPLFNELGDGSVLVTPDLAEPGPQPGGYVVQFLPFRRDNDGLAALRWWRERCLEWCYDRVEDEKFGDQGYLDDWPDRFKGVRVLAHPGGMAGPWNDAQFTFSARDGVVELNGRPLIFYHFATLRLYEGRLTALPRHGVLAGFYRSTPEVPEFVWAIPFAIADETLRLAWDPYIRRLAEGYRALRRVEPTFGAGLARLTMTNVAYQATRWAVPRPVRSFARSALGERIYAAVRRPFYRPS